MRMIAMILTLSLAACAGGGANTQGGIGNPTGPTNPTITPAETVFLGDAILGGWSLPPQGNVVILAKGKAEDFAQVYGSKCVSGCSPSQFQTVAAGKKRLVFVAGAFDAAEVCGGNKDTDFSFYYGQMVQTAIKLYSLSVIVATVPQSYDGDGKPTCTAAIAEINGQIKQVAAAEGATVFDVNAALDSAVDFNLSDPLGTVTVPNAAGYDIMTAAYSTVE